MQRLRAWRWLSMPVRLFVCAFILAGGSFAARAQSSEPQQAAGPFTAYLPFVMGVPKADPPPPPPPDQLVKGFFADTQEKTNNAAFAVDAQGGMHLAFSYFTSISENPAAVYAYCPPQGGCGDSNNWVGVALSEDVNEVQLALTSQGKPRLLIRRQREGFNSDEYLYAECDANCTAGESWFGTIVVQPGGVDTFGKDNPQHSFALDPQDRPRFIYTYGWDGTGHPTGGYYAACDADCTFAESWTHTSIYEGPVNRSLGFDYPSLAFTSTGQPRVVANMAFSGTESQGVLYLACDENCNDISGWQALRLDERGGGTAASWDIELDPNDNPRIAFFQAATDSGSGDQLWYLSCDGNCLDLSGWQGTTIGLALTEGQNADLELDAQGRPRMAYEALSPGSLGYAWCNAGCTSAASWQHKTIEDSDKLQAELPVTKPISCDQQGWFDAIPSLALDAQGNPHVAYDAVNVARCWYDRGPGEPPGTRVEYLWRAARVAFFAQP